MNIVNERLNPNARHAINIFAYLVDACIFGPVFANLDFAVKDGALD